MWNGLAGSRRHCLLLSLQIMGLFWAPHHNSLLRSVRKSLRSNGLFVHDPENLDAVSRGCVDLAEATLAATNPAAASESTASWLLHELWRATQWLLLGLLAYVLWHRFLTASRASAPDDPDEAATRKPVEVLALFSNPTLPEQAASFGLRPLAFGQDLKVLMHALPHDELEVEPAATLLNANQALIRSQPRYLLFSGHTIMGALAFETPEGRLDTHAAPDYFVGLLAELARAAAKSAVLSKGPMGARRHPGRRRSGGGGFGFGVPSASLSLDARLSSQQSSSDTLTSPSDSSRARAGGFGLSKRSSLSEPSSLRQEASEWDPAGTNGGGGGASAHGLSEHLEAMRIAAAQRIQSFARGFGVRKGIPGGHLRKHLSRVSPEASRRGEHADRDARRIVEMLRERRAGVLPSLRPRSCALSRLGCVVLNGCDTIAIGRAVLRTLPSVAVVCWETVAEDSAARAFAVGFYGAIAEGLQRRRLEHNRRWTLHAPRHLLMAAARRLATAGADALKLLLPSSWACRLRAATATCKMREDAGPLDLRHTLDAFDAGCHSFLSAGFKFGDPLAYLHPPGHPHTLRPNFVDCEGCTPPVHGSVVLLYTDEGGATVERRGADLKSPLQAKRRSLAEFALRLAGAQGSARTAAARGPRHAPSKSLTVSTAHGAQETAQVVRLRTVKSESLEASHE